MEDAQDFNTCSRWLAASRMENSKCAELIFSEQVQAIWQQESELTQEQRRQRAVGGYIVA